MIWSDVICDVRYLMLCYVHFNQNFWAQKISLTRLLLIQLQSLRHFQFVEEVQQTQQQQRFLQRFFNVGELRAWRFFMPFFFFTWCGKSAICDGPKVPTKEQFKTTVGQWLPPNPGSSSSASFEVWSAWKAGHRVGRRENLWCPRCHKNG